MSTATDLKRTPLYEAHVRAGARLVPFAGWEMPVQYEGVRQEHVAVRTGAGLFDVSHMGEIETRGPRAEEFLRHLLTNDIAKVAPGGAQYSLLCREDGGVLDDLFTYRFAPDGDEERFLTVVNASNADTDFEWFRRQAESWDGVEVADRSAGYAMLALQGPRALEVLSAVLDTGAVPDRFHHGEAVVAGAPALVCRTGYTGEDGVELLLEPGAAPGVWDALLEHGARPAGLGARDTLRLEVCYPLYGDDLTPERTPIEAGLKWACALDKNFIGAERLRVQAEQGTAEKLVPFVFTGPGIPRQGNDVLEGGGRVGSVTSGTLSPCLEVGIGMAYVSAAMTEPGTDLIVDVRGKERPARVSRKPLYKKGD
ncbi:MAG: glycine cleavage system aminomethyltransferase GcvT [Solirubrobacterales bacterium]